MMSALKIRYSILFLCIFVSACVESYAQIDDALTVIHNRKSVRSFTGASVSREAIEKIIRAGMAAPTAVNMQPWSFVAVTERASLDALKEKLPYAKMLEKAGAAIVVCALPAKAIQQSLEFAIIDATCASENILLAIEALGLGAVWTVAYPDRERMEAVRKILGIPAEVVVLNVIPIGHPTGEDKPKDKYKPENLHWQKW
jgi:nitroreductase